MKKRVMRHKVGGRGFTRVELLVLIGVVAILMGVLLPALNRARMSSNAINSTGQTPDAAIDRYRHW